MTKATGFHVRHDLQPSFTYELLMLLRENTDGQSEDDLRAAAQMQGYTLRQRTSYSKLLKSLEELGVVEKRYKSNVLTPTGRVISEIALFQPPLLAELVHFLYYTLFDSDPSLRFSWSYRTVCQQLWLTAPCSINRDRLVNLVTQNAAECFGETSVSFSIQSVMGVLYWVDSLNPACLSEAGKLFSRRMYCPIELFVLALNHVYERHRQGNPSVFLTPQLREEICHICLIVPEAFTDLLEQSEATFNCVQVRRERGERLTIAGFNWDLLKE